MLKIRQVVWGNSRLCIGSIGWCSATTATLAAGGGASTILIAVLPLVLAWIQKQGGLQGALDKLRGQGLSSQVDDWVSTGPGDNAAVNYSTSTKFI